MINLDLVGMAPFECTVRRPRIERGTFTSLARTFAACRIEGPAFAPRPSQVTYNFYSSLITVTILPVVVVVVLLLARKASLA